MELKHRQILSAQVDLSKFNKANFEKATDEEKKQQDVMGESTTFFKDGMRRDACARIRLPWEVSSYWC